MAFDHRAPSALAEDGADDFQRHLGHAYIEPGDVGTFTVLDPARQAALKAWTARLIPGDEHWPSAADAGAAAYIDAVLARAPAVRPLLLRTLERLERAAQAAHGTGFAACEEAAQVALLGELAELGGGFDLVLELTFEAYYRDPGVNRAIEARTGFRTALPHLGSAMAPFDETRLERVKQLPPNYREVA
jgi:hypothetical protein